MSAMLVYSVAAAVGLVPGLAASGRHELPLFISRRSFLPAAAGAALSMPRVMPAHAQELELNRFEDKKGGVAFLLPKDWETQQSELPGGRRLVAAADPNDADFNVFVAYTPLAADYTGLGSFGTIDKVANTILPSCNIVGGECHVETDGIEGKLIDQKAVKGNYIYDYTITQTTAKRHLRTVFSVQLEEGRGKNIVTLTTQCLEPRYAEVGPAMSKIIDSFKYL